MATCVRIRVEAGGVELDIVGPVQIIESTAGCRMVVQLEPGSTPPEPGSAIDLSIESEDEDRTGAERFRLWCRSTHVVHHGGSQAVTVEAVDPLTCADEYPAFATWSGRRSLLALAREVLEQDPGSLQLGAESDSPHVEEDWLLQGNETGADFLRRTARRHGTRLFWARTGLAAIDPTAMPAGPRVNLTVGADLLGFATRHGPPVPALRARWVDPRTQTPRERQVAQGPDSRAMLRRRLPSASRSGTLAEASLPVFGVHGSQLELDTTRRDLRPGSRVVAEGGDEHIVMEIVHELHSLGSYSNQVVAVEPSVWALEVGPTPTPAIGTLLARVTHNDDELGQQRVRVALLDDPQARSTPWMPLAAPYGGANGGCYWVPEVDDLVVMIAEPGSPESLTCVGAVRGEAGRIPEDWWRSDNSLKCLSARGLEMRFDEQRREIRLVAGNSAIVLSESHGITLRGSRIVQKADSEVSIKGGGTIVIDGGLIRLG